MKSGITCRAKYRNRLIAKKPKFYVIDAYQVARDTGMGAA